MKLYLFWTSGSGDFICRNFLSRALPTLFSADMCRHTEYNKSVFYQRRFSESRSSSGSTPSVRLSVCLSATLLGCLVCVICNSNRFHSFIFKLCLMVVHTLKMCTSPFCAHLINIFSFLRVLNLDIFPSRMHRGGSQVCEICNSNSFHSFVFKLCIMIVHTLKICISYFGTFDKYFLIFTGVELRHFFHPKCIGGVRFV